jgi:hypothetical protein
LLAVKTFDKRVLINSSRGLKMKIKNNLKEIREARMLGKTELAKLAVTQGQAEEYYIYHDPDGKLVISNKEPPPGSKIIKQRSFPELIDSEIPQGQQRNDPQTNGQTESSPKPPKNK